MFSVDLDVDEPSSTEAMKQLCEWTGRRIGEVRDTPPAAYYSGIAGSSDRNQGGILLCAAMGIGIVRSH